MAALKNFLKMIAAVFIATCCTLLVSKLGVNNESIIMLFLLGVLFSAVMTSSRAWAAGAAVLSVMIFNFLFTEPHYTFQVYSTSDVMLLAFFLVTATVAGTVTSRLQTQMELAGSNERTAKTLYRIASGFLSASGTKGVIQKGEDMIFDYTGMKGNVLLDSEPPKGELEYPIMSASGIQGRVVLTAVPDSQGTLIVQAVCAQLGIALEREKLVAERENIRMAMERERQRTMMLRSIAHDLRSPLTALSGSGNLLSDNYDRLTDAERRKLAEDVSEETVWLIDLVENILNMTRIGEQRLVLNKQDEVIDDIVTEAAKHTERLLRDRSFTINLPDEIVTAPMDGKLIVQVIVNLLENAVRHTPEGSEITLSAKAEGSSLVVSVADTGDGVPESIKGKLFERFVTQDNGIVDGRRGLGLGLAICKTLVSAHGGTIRYEDNIPHGAVFTFTLPLEDENE